MNYQMTKYAEAILVACVGLTLSACSEQASEDTKAKNVSTTRSPLPKTELDRAAHAAAQGDVEGEMALAFHFSDLGDEEKSRYHFEKCLKGGHPECLIEKSSALYDEAMDKKTPPRSRAELFAEALGYADRAIASDKYRNYARLEGYRAQRDEIVKQLLSLKSK